MCFYFGTVEIMKLTDLSKKIDMNGKPISIGHLSEIVNRKAKPSYDTAKKIAAETNTQVDLWFEGSVAERWKAVKEAA